MKLTKNEDGTFNLNLNMDEAVGLANVTIVELAKLDEATRLLGADLPPPCKDPACLGCSMEREKRALLAALSSEPSIPKEATKRALNALMERLMGSAAVKSGLKPKDSTH